MDLQHELKLSYLFIAHDLAVVEHISHRVAVMYLGRIVEMTDKTSLFETAAASLHRGAAVGRADPEGPRPRQAQRVILAGDVPSPINPPSGCHFHRAAPTRWRAAGSRRRCCAR